MLDKAVLERIDAGKLNDLHNTDSWVQILEIEGFLSEECTGVVIEV